MINWIVKKITGKEIVIVNRHRNTIPIIEDNRNAYIFFDPTFVWRLIGFVGRRRKLRYRLMYQFLSLVKPVWIISFNWLDKLESLYLVWANHHEKQFIVVKHGIYYGGMMRDIPEKYIKCNIMLVWSDYFRNMFLENNPDKDFRCVSFGNPIYNQYDRSLFQYSKGVGNKVLLVPSLVKGHRLERHRDLIKKLKNLGFDVTLKEHYKQNIESEPIASKNTKKTDGGDFHIYNLLKSKRYDIIITDVSSAMTDIIFFKNRVIYFSPEFNGVDLNDNIYKEYLPNLDQSLNELSSRDGLLSFINLEYQEQLLKHLIKMDNLCNDLSQLNEEAKDDQKKAKLNNIRA